MRKIGNQKFLIIMEKIEKDEFFLKKFLYFQIMRDYEQEAIGYETSEY